MMRNIAQPKGINIYARKTGKKLVDGSPAYIYRATVKARGRLNSYARGLFLRASEERQQMALHDWANDRSTEALS